jgi:AcrR family transcriptional regulator
VPASPEKDVLGLRARKKQKTRAAIQEQALRLFRERGYDETTIEDIAAASDISESTFFRYFPTKEEVVMYDPLDDELIAMFLAQPQELSVVDAFRATMRAAYGEVFSPGAVAAQEQRDQLARHVPALRARMLEEFVRGIGILTDAIAKRSGRRRDDPDVATVAGALGGVILQYWANGTHHRFRDYAKAIDRALERLAKGVPLLTAKSRR